MKCDRALLEAAERLAREGPICLAEAMELWEKAKDGHVGCSGGGGGLAGGEC